MLDATSQPIQIIVAVDTTGGFGKDGKIPWNIPEDTKRFRNLTEGGVCIMGRGTYDDIVQMKSDRMTEIPGIPKEVVSDDVPLLPGRMCFVVTSDVEKLTPGATTASSITDAITQIKAPIMGNIFVLGGKRLFIEALSRPNGCVVHMTIVKGDPYGCDNNQRFPIDVLNRSHNIVKVDESDLCQYITYHPKLRR